MQTSQGSMLVSLLAVQAFLDQNALALTGVINTGARVQLTDAIAALSTHRSEQSANALASQGSTKSQQALRLVLMRDHMAPIARIARLNLPQTPAIEPLRMPRGRPSIPKLVAAAEGMAKAATPYASDFVASGMPADFTTQLTDAASALLASTADHATIRGKRTGATGSLKAQLSAGRKIVHVLDAFVQTALKDEPTLLSNWNSVKRVQRTGTGRSAPTTPAAAPTTTPTTSPAAPATPAVAAPTTPSTQAAA